MVAKPKKLILWTGPRHSGKTTRAEGLVKTALKAGFNVAGLLAPSLYRNGKLIGFDALHIQKQTRKPLNRWDSNEAQTKYFEFIPEGLKLGYSALSETSTEFADLIIVDEFGPLELDGRIWREAVDSLLACSNGLILLVVRQELVRKVHQLYTDIPSQELPANEPESTDKVINILKNHRQLHWIAK